MHRINETSDKCHEIWSNNRNLIENFPGKIRNYDKCNHLQIRLKMIGEGE